MPRGLGVRVRTCGLLLVMVVIAGCVDTADEPTRPTPGPILVTSPDDYSYLGNATDAQAHLHDYWNGLDRLLIMDSVGHGQVGLAGGPYTPVAVFEPEPGAVIPLGTASVEVTMTWTADPGSMHGPPELWVKTAADHDAWRWGVITPGEVMVINVSSNDQNDLPHNVLSAWRFEFSVPQDGELPTRYEGDIDIQVEAVRGLDIPLFPGHPDRWDNTTEIVLFEGERSVPFYQEDQGGGNCLGNCIGVWSPLENVTVPPETERVEVVVTFVEPQPNPFSLSFRAADRREPTHIEADTVDGATHTFVIPIEGPMADGPYSIHSQWVFHPDPEPQPYGNFQGTYSIHATAYRGTR